MTPSTPVAVERETIDKLLERLRAATGPGRELDAELAFTFYPKAFVRGRSNDADFASPFTVSLDAALALVERVLPGAKWSAHPHFEGGQTFGLYHGDRLNHWGTAPHPPLALLIALLEALRASAEGVRVSPSQSAP